MVEKISEEFLKVLNHQLKILENFSQEESRLKGFIQEKDWKGLEDSLLKINEISSQMEGWEYKREKHLDQLRKELKSSEYESFYQLTRRIGTPKAALLNAAYQRLKTETIKIRGRMKALNDLVQLSRMSIQYAIEDIFPARKGKLYNPRGKAKESDHGAILLNTVL